MTQNPLVQSTLLIWSNHWVAANQTIETASIFETPDGQSAVADGGSTPKIHDGWMWDLTVPGNNDHDFYVDHHHGISTRPQQHPWLR